MSEMADNDLKFLQIKVYDKIFLKIVIVIRYYKII